MGKFCCNKCLRQRLGLICCSAGAGIILAVLIPFWIWLLVGGIVLVGVGWCLINKFF